MCTSSHSWFVYCARRFSRYNLDPLLIISNQLSTTTIKANIRDHHSRIIHLDAASKSSMKYLHLSDLKLTIKHPHPIWSCFNINHAESRKAAIKARLLTGCYILQSNRAALNQYNVVSTCPPCQTEPEDRQHFILRCHTLSDVRSKYLSEVAQHIPDYHLMDSDFKCTATLDSMTILKPVQQS